MDLCQEKQAFTASKPSVSNNNLDKNDPNVGAAHNPVFFRARARHRYRNRGKNPAIFAFAKSLNSN